MKDSILKLTEEIAEKMNSHFASADFQSILKTIKEAKAEDTGSFRMIISTDDTDRHGEIVVQEGINTSNYMNNAVVLWGHDSYSPPVGITEKIVLERVGNKVQTIAEGKFAPTPFAQELRKLYEAGMLNTSSIGFIPTEYEGNKITKCELLEWSFVSIPANPFAVAVRSLGLKLSELVSKGIMELKEGEIIKTNDEGEEEVEKEEIEDVPNPKNETEDNVDDPALHQIDSIFIEDEEEKTFLSLTDSEGKVMKFEINSQAKETLNEIRKAGRVISKNNLEKLKTAFNALEEIIKIAESEDDEKSNDDVINDIPADKNDKEIEDFLILRRGVQGVFSDLQEILKDAKKRASDKIKVR